jgi:trans-AT polyketide synthase/acyltransferase/oxidoreductase domain-containing protein
MQYRSLEEIPADVQKQLQERYFRRTFEQIWSDVTAYLGSTGRQHEVAAIEANPKQKMARIFKWYFAFTTQIALSGDEDKRVDFQVHTGPSLGAFNQWLKGTELESWRARHVDDIADRLMTAAAAVLTSGFSKLRSTIAAS